MIFLTGPHGAGKTAAARILRQKGYLCVDLGPILREVFKTSKSKKTFAEWVADGERCNGAHFTDEVLAGEIRKRLAAAHRRRECDVVIIGNRSMRGVRYLMRKLRQETTRHTNVIVFIDAPIEILRVRYARREGRMITTQEFSRLLTIDKKIGIESLRRHADYLIMSDTTSLRRKVEDLLKAIAMRRTHR